MARLNTGLEPVAMREQLAAIAELRWRVFLNSLRTLHGRLDLASRIVAGFGYAMLGLVGAAVLAVAAWYAVSHDALVWLALPFWGIFLYWQLFPVMATAFAENFDATNFLRFPLSYPSYFLMRLAYGSLDPTTLVALLWLAGIALGAITAAPRLFLWIVVVLAGFAAFNIFLSRAIFSWIERWLARRKSREILGIFFLFLVIGVQFISPLANYYTHGYGRFHRPDMTRSVANFIAVERFLPPGLASEALSRAAEGAFRAALVALAFLCVYAAAFLALFHLRLRAQYSGENLNEASAPAAARAGKGSVSAGWNLRGLSGPIAAIFEKELRYLSRSGPMLFTLVMPVVVLLIFRFSLASGSVGRDHFQRGGDFLQRHADLAFPIATAYALLIVTNLVYNCFGVDGTGVQLFFMSPVRFRDVLLAKNLAQSAILALEVFLVWVAASILFRPPAIGMTVATLAGALFGALANFSAGNLLSLYSPKKFDFAVLGRQRAAGTTVIASLGVQVVIFGLGALALFFASEFNNIWLAVILLLVFAAAALIGYTYALGRVEAIAIGRRETLIAELCRA